MVQETDHRSFRHDGPEDLREPRPSPAQSHQHRRDPFAAASGPRPQFKAAFGPARCAAIGGARLGTGPISLGFFEQRFTDRDVWLVRDPRKLADTFEKVRPVRELFVIGGAQIYAQLLDHCTDLYLTVVQREVEGDAYFPEFEDRWRQVDIPLRTADFEVRHFRRLQP